MSLPSSNQATFADRQSKLVANASKYQTQMSLPERVNDSNSQRAVGEENKSKRNSTSNLHGITNNNSPSFKSSELRNPGDVYVANTIQTSTAKDYPPSKIHAIQKSERSLSTPVDINRTSTLSNVFVYSAGLPVHERDEEEGEEMENFRARSRNNVDPREKLKWYEKKRRSLSCPSKNFVFVERYDTFHV